MHPTPHIAPTAGLAIEPRAVCPQGQRQGVQETFHKSWEGRSRVSSSPLHHSIFRLEGGGEERKKECVPELKKKRGEEKKGSSAD